jgi:hypothetical protein
MERQFLAGAGAGAITKTSVAPMERLKVIFQTSGMVCTLLPTLAAVVLCTAKPPPLSPRPAVQPDDFIPVTSRTPPVYTPPHSLQLSSRQLPA